MGGDGSGRLTRTEQALRVVTHAPIIEPMGNVPLVLPNYSGIQDAAKKGSGVTLAASHTRQHAITTAADHTSTATSGKMLKADANGLPVDATNTDAEASTAYTHSQDNTQAHSDYLLNSGADTAVGPLTTTADNETADTEYIPNVLFGTDAAPPAANTVSRGSIYVQYTA